MTTEKLSALISLGSAIAIVAATFFQWWDINYDGYMRLRPWIRLLLVAVVVALLVAVVLLFI